MMESKRSNAPTITTSSVAVGATDQPRTIVSSTTLSPFYRPNMTPDKQSCHSIVYCRICHEADDSIEELIDPCDCTGSLGLIHASCLEKWLSSSNTDHCEICKYAFVIEKKKKPLCQSCCQWWRSKSAYGPQGITGDVICLIVLTPLCVVATYLCGIGANAYTRLGFWEGIGLAILCCMLVITFFLWLIITIRFHCISLIQWRKRNLDVKLIVKHKSQTAHIKAYWITSNDRNNDRSNNNPFTCFLTTFGDNDDSFYNIQQQMTFV
ncbi:E3 ubiquitin-protein ligase MARCHF2-like isoform X1 [Vespa crabro]|uniref:E3 ubiquitin-protein ligase MARCHF2-like isoform X1 n=1 Tax=Vespa crabro TaxID=7445 RepID=UPI001F0206F1|nr:E3 ubiquitin-protein ligase MARCHF2-like isoform X1 [Vespa crabro]